ncbi:GNAT family N-acetyltransferase [Pectobacterium polaris]|uniref:GNAT family N-acetyltransferase n=1 Tax=Pectobacterium polaris TaxID=2042057 RepID=UPI0019698721|nr:GNAT family N-acetyltransferase [Pectobacterium polaris]MBN3218223.1 GNAT family N-acetyltransferase [Pectobacterium polaris]
MGAEIATFVAEYEGNIVGMYKIIPNRQGLGDHVANASFMVSPEHTGKGIGRLLGIHCLREAKKLGYVDAYVMYRFLDD